MKLQIRTQPALIDWRTTDAEVTTPSMPKDPLKLDIKEPELKMDIKEPKININQDQCFNESGLKNNDAFLADMISRSQSAHMEGLAHRVDEGNQMMAIENGGDVFAQNAINNAWERFYNEFGLVTMPKSRPEISVDRGNIEYDFIPGEVTVLNDVFEIDKGTYQPWKIEYYMKQKFDHNNTCR